MNVSKREWIFIGIGALLFIGFVVSHFFSFTSTSELSDELFEWQSIEANVAEEVKTEDDVLMVDVKGEVLSPGVYQVKAGQRVHDVIELAGGLTEDADQSKVNLAALLEDEMVVFIPKIGEEAEQAFIGVTDDFFGNKDGKVAINQATSTELETLPGIGPAKAAAIISYREEHGPFKTIDDLLNISGIGPKSLEKLKDHVKIK